MRLCNFYAPHINRWGILFYCCLSVHLSVCPSAKNSNCEFNIFLKLSYYSSYNAHIRYAGIFLQYPTIEGHIIKVKVEYQGYISQRNGRFGGISVSQTHLVCLLFVEDLIDVAHVMQFVCQWIENVVGKRRERKKCCNIKAVYPFPKQALVFMCLQYKYFENTVGKGEIARNEQFLLFPRCFLPVWRTFGNFHRI